MISSIFRKQSPKNCFSKYIHARCCQRQIWIYRWTHCCNRFRKHETCVWLSVDSFLFDTTQYDGQAIIEPALCEYGKRLIPLELHLHQQRHRRYQHYLSVCSADKRCLDCEGICRRQRETQTNYLADDNYKF